MGRAQCQRGHCGINDVGARLNALEQAHGGKAGRVVRVQLNGQVNGLFQCGDEFLCLIRREQRCHILNADGIGPCIADTLGVLDVVIRREDRAGRIRNGNLDVRALVLSRVDSSLQIFNVVEGIKDTDNVDAVRDTLLHEVFEHIVRIMAVAQHILAAEQHLQLRVRAIFAQHAQTFPRVLI